MSNHTGPKETIELLDSLKNTVRDFTAREEKLKRESSTDLAKLRRRFGIELEQNDARFAQDAVGAESSVHAKREKIERIHEARKIRTSAAHKSSRQQRRKEVEEQEGRCKFEVQRDTLQTNRTREIDLKTAESNFATFTSDLAVERAILERLEDRARRAFRGYGKFRRLLSAPPPAAEPDLARSEHQILDDLRHLLAKTDGRLRRFGISPLPLLFRWFPLWLLIPLIVLVHAALATPVAGQLGLVQLSHAEAARYLAASLGGILLLYFIGLRLARPGASGIAAALAQARRLHDAGEQNASTHHHQEIERINTEADNKLHALEQQWNEGIARAEAAREKWAGKLKEQLTRVTAGNEDALRREIQQLDTARQERITRLRTEADARRRQLEQARAEEEARINAIYEGQWQTLTSEWQSRMQPLYNTIAAAQAKATALFPDWKSAAGQWTPPGTFAHAARFARIEVDVTKLAGALPQDQRLALPGPPSFSLPLMLTVPDQGSVLFETKHTGREEVIGALNNIILRLFATTPPGKLNFTIIDPVELGQNFAGVMHVADFEARLINDRIWTQTSQIEEKLADLNEHIEKVTQMYLRNEYETITQYNEQAGRIAEKYHFLVVADFPAGFSDIAARRLLSIVASGARCGVYTLIHWDQRKPLPHDFVEEQLKSNSVSIRGQLEGFTLAGQPAEGTTLSLEAPPDPDLATAFLQKVGRASIDSNRVEMPFAEIAPDESRLWSLETTKELRVPIGRTGATKFQYLALGKGTRQHALIAGKTGSGKSTLFHVIITNLALWCSPDQVEFYLVDFKKGVEFKCYAAHRLPHARVVAIESDREFGLSVLQRVDDELKRRGDLFRKLGAQDLAGYKKAGGTEALPRTLLLIDEFQEFFVEDDRISQSAALLLDRIVRQGRAFGIHVLLGSQTLGGAYTLARTTLGQMVVRVALQCNEADAFLIMDDDNPAPRLLSRPGEAIYNDAAGSIEGNSPFQVVWLPDEEREASLEKIRRLAEQTPASQPPPIVFEGNAPADLRENHLLRGALEARTIKPAAATRVWLGAPNAIKGPTEAVFRRQSGNNLLIVGQRDEAILAMMGISLVSLAAQHPRGAARFILFDSSAPGSPEREFIERAVQSIPHDITLANNADIENVMAGLKEEMDKRSGSDHAATVPPPASPPRALGGSEGAAPTIYLLIHGLQRFKKLRYEEDFEFSIDPTKPMPPGNQLNRMIAEGASLGIHVICACDTANNLSRSLSRKAVSEFEMRVLFQMSVNDSATLIDTPKAGALGLHRAIFWNGHEGYLETFRPYALPDNDWLEQAAQQLARLPG